MTEGYVELHTSSAFSFLEGASLPESLIERAVELEMPAIALLDRNGLYGSARFLYFWTNNSNVRAHMGAEISVMDLGLQGLIRPRENATPPISVSEPVRLPLLCASRSRAGYQNICQMITQFKMRETLKCEGSATFDDLEQFSSGLICLTGGDEGPLAAALNDGERRRCRNQSSSNG